MVPESDLPDKDEALQALLKELGDVNPLPGSPLPAPPPIQEPAPKLNEIKAIKRPSKLKEIEKNPDDLSEKYKAIILKYGVVADEVLGKYRTDREQIQEAIDHCRDVVQNGGKVPTAYIEGWISSLGTLADTNSTAVKLLDSFAKFMAAGKNSEVINNLQVNNFDGAKLAELLAQDKFPDEIG